MVRRLLAALACAIAALSAAAATVAERSPFAQGLWWNASQPGTGFDMLSAAGNVMVVWYTYDGSGRPVWYTAQGPESTLGQDWPLLRHRWTNGKAAAPTTAGSLRVTLAHAESATISWQVGPVRGTTAVTPYLLSGIVNEVDHTGLWFDPENAGWGLTLMEQGPYSGAVLFTYDASGESTWAAGFERGQGGATLYTARGACLGCAHTPPLMTPVGRVTFQFGSETNLTFGDATTLGIAPGVGMQAAKLRQLGRPASMRAADRSLAAFDAPTLKQALVGGMGAMPGYGPCGGIDFSPAPAGAAGVAFSPTNTQEAGVDEAALVRTNGNYVYTYAHGSFNNATLTTRMPQVRIARIDDAGGQFAVKGAVSIGSGPNTPMGTAGLYLRENQLVSVHGSLPRGCGLYGWSSGPQWMDGLTQVEVMDIAANPELPATKWGLGIDGHLVASRRVGPMLYVVTRYLPKVAGVQLPAFNATQAAANQQVLQATPLEVMLPARRVTGEASDTRLAVDRIYATPQAGGPLMPDMVVVTAIDLDRLRVTDAMAVMGSSEAVYASTSKLVLASGRVTYRGPTGALLPQEPYFARTDLHMVSFAGDRLQLAGSSAVEGILNANPDMAPLRMSESGGQLRIVTTSNAGLWGTSTRNRLTILEPSTAAPGLLKTVSTLPNERRPEPLGKPNETLHATRFAGDRLYAVTFVRIDPLYVVDLSVKEDPRIASALDVPGFAEYLHPLANGYLLGFGRDAKPAASVADGGFAWIQGLQLTVYDMRDASRPREVDKAVIGKRGSGSALFSHHHAFAALPMADGIVVGLPAQVNDGQAYFGSGDSAYYAWQYNGVVRYKLTGLDTGAPRFVELPNAVTSRATGVQFSGPASDDVTASGRPVLFPNGTVYVGNGRFWHQGSTGSTTGPH